MVVLVSFRSLFLLAIAALSLEVLLFQYVPGFESYRQSSIGLPRLCLVTMCAPCACQDTVHLVLARIGLGLELGLGPCACQDTAGLGVDHHVLRCVFKAWQRSNGPMMTQHLWGTNMLCKAERSVWTW